MNVNSECDECGITSVRLHYSKAGWLCRDCHVPPKQFTDVNLGTKVGNKYKPNMTYADKMNIITRRISPDGVVRAHPRWETKEW